MACAGVAGTGATTGDDVPAVEEVGAAAKGRADNGLDHGAEAAALAEAGSATAEVDGAGAALIAGVVGRCVLVDSGTASATRSATFFTAASFFQTVPVTVWAGAVLDAARAVAAAATGIASASERAGVSATGATGRGEGVATCSAAFAPFTPFTPSRGLCAESADTTVSAERAGCDSNGAPMRVVVAASFASKLRAVSLAADVTAIEAWPAATGSPPTVGEAAIGLFCGASIAVNGGLTLSSHGAMSIGAWNAGATGASATCRLSSFAWRAGVSGATRRSDALGCVVSPDTMASGAAACTCALGSAGTNASSTIGASSYAGTGSCSSRRPVSRGAICGAAGTNPPGTAVDAGAATLLAAAIAPAAVAAVAVVFSPFVERVLSSVAHCAVLASIERSVS